MTLPASGAISLSGVNTELGYLSTAQISLNDSAVRTLAGKSSGAISLDDLHGKSNTFSFTISSNTADVNLRTAALAAGWNGSAVLYATIASGVVVYSTSTSNAALTVSGSFPNGVYLTNSGTILGKGGSGGSGGSYGSSGSAGGAGGTGMAVSSNISITNNGRIAGGGGGGAGGASGSAFEGNYEGGGGGGGGIGYGDGGARGSGDVLGQAGTAGTATTAGSGGTGYIYGTSGGSYGAAGGNSYSTSGGAAGACLTGNSYITWLATGTRNGTIS